MKSVFRKTVLILCIAAVLLIAASPAAVCLAQDNSGIDVEALDNYIQEQMRICRIPGFSVGIVKDGATIYQNGYGKADRAGTNVTAQTPFVLGSVSKTFTALAVMQLAEAGKIDLDTAISSYLPDFALAGGEPSRVTIRQLLNHTSGIPEESEFGVATLRGDDESISELVAKFNRIVPDAAPGAKFEYSNANYILLGELVQQVSGQTYEAYIRQNIFEPLGMAHSYLSREEASGDGMAAGYLNIFGFASPSYLPYRSDFLPAYSIISCAEDMTHYMIAMMSGGTYQGNSILSEQGIWEMTQGSADISSWLSYGLGWYVTSGSIYHGGDLPDYQAKVKLLPEDGIGVVLMYNTSGSTAAALFNAGYRDNIETGIINILCGASPYDLPGRNPLSLSSYPMTVTYTLMLALPVTAILLAILSFVRLRMFRKNIEKSKRVRIRVMVLSALANIVLPVGIFLGVALKAQGSWRFVLYYLPDIGWTAMVFSVLMLASGVIKIIMLVKNSRERAAVGKAA